MRPIRMKEAPRLSITESVAGGFLAVNAPVGL
jgi:hypothetical protein